MKFCDECSGLTTPVTATGELRFHCRCKKVYEGTDEDTLRYESNVGGTESNSKYTTFIKNSSFDPAGTKVGIMCPSCYMPYLTMIYIGKGEVPIYTCTCGNKYRQSDLQEQKK